MYKIIGKVILCIGHGTDSEAMSKIAGENWIVIYRKLIIFEVNLDNK